MSRTCRRACCACWELPTRRAVGGGHGGQGYSTRGAPERVRSLSCSHDKQPTVAHFVDVGLKLKKDQHLPQIMQLVRGGASVQIQSLMPRLCRAPRDFGQSQEVGSGRCCTGSGRTARGRQGAAVHGTAPTPPLCTDGAAVLSASSGSICCVCCLELVEVGSGEGRCVGAGGGGGWGEGVAPVPGLGIHGAPGKPAAALRLGTQRNPVGWALPSANRYRFGFIENLSAARPTGPGPRLSRACRQERRGKGDRTV